MKDLASSSLVEKSRDAHFRNFDINRSSKFIYQVLSYGCKYKVKCRSGRPHVRDILDDHLIQRLANAQQMSVHEVEMSLGFSVSKDTIHRRIVEKGTIVHSKIKKKPERSHIISYKE